MIYSEFRKLLREAMGTQTQSSFSNLSGISVEHLNRMLNKDDMSRPSKTTLRKILAVSPSINPNELYASCGYPADDVPLEVTKMRSHLTLKERMDLTVKDIVSGFGQLIREAKQYDSLSEMMMHYVEHYGVDARKVSYQSKTILAPYEWNGDFVVPCIARWRVRKDARYYYDVETYFAVLYVRTSKDKILATDVVLNPAYLFRLGFLPQHYVDMLHEDGTSVMKLPYFSMATQKYDENSPEHRLLSAIFGDAESKERELSLFHTTWGRGSVYTYTPPGFVDYVLQNEDFFKESEEEQEFLDELHDVPDMTADDLDDLFREYFFDGARGTAGAVLAIMSRKFKSKGFEFDVDYGVSEDFEEVFKPVLYVSEDWYTCGESLNTVKMHEIDDVLKAEFKVLKMPTYGGTLVYAAYNVDPEHYLEGQEPLV